MKNKDKGKVDDVEISDIINKLYGFSEFKNRLLATKN